MSLLFIDSFDHYGTSYMDYKYESVTGSAYIGSGGRNSSYRLHVVNTGQVTKTLTNITTWIVGFAFRYTGDSSVDSTFLQFYDDSTAQMTFKMSPHIDKKIHVYNGAYDCGDSTATLEPDTWYFLEFKITFDSMAGIVTIKKNGATIFDYMGQTTVSAHSYANKIQLHGLEYDTWFDDLYICDDSGATNNDFLGDCRVECLFPTASGDTTEWTPSNGDNYDCVNDIAPDDDDSYVKAIAEDQVDLYNYGDLAESTGTILGVQPIIYAKKTDTDTHTIRIETKTHSTEYEGTEHTLDTSYAYYMDIQETNPNTSSAWTIDEINAAQFGAKAES